MKLVVISSPDTVKHEALLIASMLEIGLDAFHLRKPDWTAAQHKQLLDQIPESLHFKIVIHTHYGLAEQYTLKGIHWPALKRQVPPAKACLPAVSRQARQPISTSFHDLSELVDPATYYEYCFISPVYDSISKTGYPAKFNKKELQHTLSQTSLNMIALGGITVDRIQDCKALGFSGVATLGAIWQADSPLESFYQFHSKINELL